MTSMSAFEKINGWVHRNPWIGIFLAVSVIGVSIFLFFEGRDYGQVGY